MAAPQRAQGLLTRTRKDGSAEKIAATERERQAYAEFDRIGREAVAGPRRERSRSCRRSNAAGGCQAQPRRVFVYPRRLLLRWSLFGLGTWRVSRLARV
jgi:hypothetical protein